MTPEQIEQLGPAFADYLRPFLFCCDYTQTFDLLGVYCRGLLSDLDRKTCEPIALYAGVAVRTLQEFLRDHLWSFERVRDLLQQHVAGALADLPADDLGTVGLHDETGTVKGGTHTPGARRTGEQECFVPSAAAEPVERAVRAGFSRRSVQHGIRLGEGRSGTREGPPLRSLFGPDHRFST